MPEWFHTFDDNLWLEPDEVGAEEAAFIRKALRLRKGQSVLDAPCGAGRIAIYLAKGGCVVTGVDLRERFLKRANSRFRKEGVAGTFLAMDLRTMDFKAAFHGIYNWFGSFGYFSDTDNFDLIQRYAQALRPGGRLLIDQPNREHLLRNFRATMKKDILTIHNRWDAQSERILSTWTLRVENYTKKNFISMRLYTPRQICRMFERAGLQVEAIYGNHTGESFQRSGKRLIVVGRK